MKAKTNSREDLPPPQTRSLRSRKREYPSEEAPETNNSPAALHQKDKEEDDTGVVASLLQSLLQECAAMTNQQDPAVEQTIVTTEENPAEASNVAATGQEVDTFTSPNNDSQLESWRLHTSNDTQNSREIKEGVTSEEHQTPTELLKLISPVSEDAGESCATALEKEVDREENASLERNQDTSKDQTSVSTDDVMEAAVGLPAAKKKRRMGMCGLTEKERNLFLQGQKHENDGKGAGKVENPILSETLEEDISSSPSLSLPLCVPAGCIPERSELQFSSCAENDRAESEVHIAVTTSDGISAVCDPGCSEASGTEADTAFGAELTAKPESFQLAQKEDEEERLDNLDMQEFKRPTAENMAEMCEKQMKKMEEESKEDHKSSAITYHRGQNDKPNNQNTGEAAEMSGTTRADERKGEVTGSDTCDAADAMSGGPNCDSVKLCEAAVTPGVPKWTNKCDPDVPEHAQTRNPDDTFGSGCIDYVSDSQLNTIVLNEVVREKEDDPHPTDCFEDGTSLICGLIRELSSLNRKVMAAHRELENVRRSSKTSRNALH